MDFAKSTHEHRMRALASDDSNVVYEYTYDTPVRSACPEQALKLAKAAVEWRQTKGKRLSDAEARAELLTSHEDSTLMTDFSQSFPKAFEMITEKEQGPRHFSILMKMARLASTAEAQRMPEAEATAQVNALLQSECALGPA